MGVPEFTLGLIVMVILVSSNFVTRGNIRVRSRGSRH